MRESACQLNEYQDFLAALTLNKALRKIKTIECDLYGLLNPTNLLDKLFFEEQKWLNFEAFFHHYMGVHEEKLKRKFKHIPWHDLLEGLKARLYRTQFGILTEYHAYYLAQHIFGEQHVSRNTHADKKGVDFQLLFSDKIYNIHIFVDTPRAWVYRNYKSTHKRSNIVEGVHVNLPYALKTGKINSLAYLPNGFGIFTTRYFQYFKEEIEKGNIKNNNISGVAPEGFVYSF